MCHDPWSEDCTFPRAHHAPGFLFSHSRLDEYSNAVQDKFIAVADTNMDGQISMDEALEFNFGPNPGDG